MYHQFQDFRLKIHPSLFLDVLGLTVSIIGEKFFEVIFDLLMSFEFFGVPLGPIAL